MVRTFINFIFTLILRVYLFEKEIFTISRLATLRNTPGASTDLLYLLGNMAGLLGTSPPSDDSTASSMMGLMGNAYCSIFNATDAIVWSHSQTLVPIIWKHVLTSWMHTLYCVRQIQINS